MSKETILENESIQNGLEKFLEEELKNTSYQTNKPNNPSTAYQDKAPVHAADTIDTIDITPIIDFDVIHSHTSQTPVDFELTKTQDIQPQADNIQTRTPKSSNRSDNKQVTLLNRFGISTDEEDTEEDPFYRKNTSLRGTTPAARNGGNRSNTSANSGYNNDDYNNNKNKGSNKKLNGAKNSSKKGKAKKKKKNKFKGFLIKLSAVIAVLLVIWYVIVGNIYKKMEYSEASTLSSEAMKQEGVINILLIGNDSREAGDDGRSDAMILLSISKHTKTIHMTSLLRDMYVDIPGHDGNRLNAAYSYGGAELLCQTIEQNLGIDVNRYVLVNFQAFANLVDAVGGIDLELSNDEVQWVNAYLNEYNLLEGKEMTTDYLDTSLSGMIHLNGPQALAYSRNRYIGTDFGRTERQRKVLSEVIKKLPKAAATNSGEVINGLFPNLTTNLTQNECYRLSFSASKLFTYEIVQSTIPAEGTYSNATIRGMAVLEVDFDANKQLWRKDIFGE